MKLLSPFGKLYGRIMDARNALYDRGWLKSYPLGARTISVGNLTTGGTGKTPLVALIAEMLIENGEKVCILTRGYGRENPRSRVLVADGKNVLVDAVTGGDEPVELAHKLGAKAIIVADPDRVAAAKWARENFPVTTFILDDGFQHRRAKRDLDIVCIDATNPCGNGRILPAGTLRESFKGLRRADAIVATRTNLVESTDSLVQRLRKRNGQVPIFGAETRIAEITKLSDFTAAKNTEDDDEDRQHVADAFAFCALGNPEGFFALLKNERFHLSGVQSYPDHHFYSQKDVEAIESTAVRCGSRALITTGKDARKLEDLRFTMHCFVAEMAMEINDPTTFRKLISS